MRDPRDLLPSLWMQLTVVAGLILAVLVVVLVILGWW